MKWGFQSTIYCGEWKVWKSKKWDRNRL